MNQVIRIIFDDHISHKFAKSLAEDFIELYGNVCAVEVYEEEFKDEDENGQEQRQESK